MSSSIRLHPNGLDVLSDIIIGYDIHNDDGGSNLPYRRFFDIQTFFTDLGVTVVLKDSRAKTARATLSSINGKESLKICIEAALLPAHFVGMNNPSHASEGIEDHLKAVGWRLDEYPTHVRVMPSDHQNLTGVHAELIEAAKGQGFTVIIEHLEKCGVRSNNDPEGALTAACSLLETTCKVIHELHQTQLPNKQDIQSLYKSTAKILKLSPDTNSPADIIRDDVFKIMSGLIGVVGGLGSLRTHAGDAHGRGIQPKRIDARLARVGINTASALSLFLLETSARNLSMKNN
jgi:hypothetical protein